MIDVYVQHGLAKFYAGLTQTHLLIVTITFSDDSPLWILNPTELPLELERADDPQIASFIKKRYPETTMAIILKRENGRSGLLMFDSVGNLVQHGGDEEE